MRWRRWLAAGGCAWLVAVVGCGGANLARVTGTVTYQGKPVDGAVVSFRCEQAGKMATGTTDLQGRFTLTTHPDGAGAVVGTHTVTVAKFAAPAGGGPAASMDDMVAQAKAPPLPPANALPARYADPAQSGLTFTVSASGPNEFAIELKD